MINIDHCADSVLITLKNKNKNKNMIKKYSIYLLLLLMFVLGFLTNIFFFFNEFVSEKNMTETYKKYYDFYELSSSIDSIESLSKANYDTANIEILHYIINYKNLNEKPETYITYYGDTIEYNKDNFFQTVALLTVAQQLLETRKYIIDGLLLNAQLNEEKKTLDKIKHHN